MDKGSNSEPSQLAKDAGDDYARWMDWHNAMLVAGLGRTPQDALPRYVAEALRLADAEQAELRAEVERLRGAIREYADGRGRRGAST